MDATIQGIDVSAYEIPTDGPESDGTLEWHATTLAGLAASGLLAWSILGGNRRTRNAREKPGQAT